MGEKVVVVQRRFASHPGGLFRSEEASWIGGEPSLVALTQLPLP